MSAVEKLEEELLLLPPRDRERLALAAWESLKEVTDWLADPNTDRAGLGLALERDAEIESGNTAALTEEEFRRRTHGAAE